MMKKVGHYVPLSLFLDFMSLSSIYLIPAPLFPQEVDSIPMAVRKTAVQLKHYFVENIRTARRVLKLYDPEVVIDEVQFVEMNHRVPLDTGTYMDWMKKGYNIGIMSEAGLPALADPGAQLVSLAHQYHAKVFPLPGPGSIYLSLMGSGMNGQQFEFLGYLPIDTIQRTKALKCVEEKARRKITQIFIETPYRNNQLFEQLLKTLHPDLDLCVAFHLTAPDQFIRTRSVGAWKQQKPDLHKKPCIFLAGKV